MTSHSISECMDQRAKSFLQLLLDQRISDATPLVISWLDGQELSLKEVYLEIFAPSQIEVGRLWQEQQITVAQEHYCTAATQMVMSQLYSRLFDGTFKNKVFVGVCSEGNLHELPMRMVTDFFEMEGWDSHYLGASVPPNELVKFLEKNSCDVLGISTTLDEHLESGSDMVQACRQAFGAKIKILMGGRALMQNPQLALDLGADGVAPNAEEAIAMANSFLEDTHE